MFRKSNKQRRVEIMAARRKRIKRPQDRFAYAEAIPATAVAADPAQLQHNCTCQPLPLFYVDHRFTCRDCAIEQVWTANQQKWWYEVAKGRLDAVAIRCRPCRKQERARKAAARTVHLTGLANKRALIEVRNKLSGHQA